MTDFEELKELIRRDENTRIVLFEKYDERFALVSEVIQSLEIKK